MIMSVCLLAIACTKAMPTEPEIIPAGEKVTFTIPETKVAIGADDGNGARKYVFESADVIYAVTSEGSVAAMEYKGDNRFAGEFSKPVGADEKVNLYYGCWSAESNAPVYAQNGKPWLLSFDNDYSRDENNTITLSATLDAPEGVVGMPIISTFGACTVDFSAKSASIASFDGTSFSGGKTISGISLVSHAETDASEYTAVVNLPSGMAGGFWLKVSKDGQTMYRSSAASVGGKSFRMSSFTAASVNLNVAVSGFQTTYSYGVGTDGVSKNASTANSKSNSWMSSGEATYTLSTSGIPAALLTFKSFTISGEGISASGNETSRKISVGETSHTSWGAKTITATVIYSDIAGNTYTKSASVTRHITGLPYNKDKNSASNFSGDWSTSGGKSGWYDGYLRYGSNCIVTFKGFHIPSGSTVESTILYKITSYTSSRINPNTTSLTVGSNTIFDKEVTGTAKTVTYESSANVSLTASTQIKTTSNAGTSSWAVSQSQLHYFGAIYR